MDKLAKHSWPSTDTLVIIVSLAVISGDLDLVLTVPEVSTSHTKPARPMPG
jgi:hypothetical protein